MGENSPVLWEGDEPMEQKKRIWWTFQLWEADAFGQYLEEMALKGWFLESVGGAVMKFHKGQPEKRRYVALLVPESSSLTGTDDWKAGQLRQQCEEAGWKVQCSSTYWQIFYTTDDAVKRVGDMKEEKQFQLQRSLSWNWWVKIFYPILVVLEICVSVSAKSRKIVCRFHEDFIDPVVNWHEHFLDCILCADVSLEPWKYGSFKERRAASEIGF